MALQTMYPGQVNSPVTELESAIGDSDTAFAVVDGDQLPDAPNIAVIGSGETAETILYEVKSGNNLTSVTRGFQGTAKAWGAGIKVARFFTAYDYDALRQNVGQLKSDADAHLADKVTDSGGVHGLVVESGTFSPTIRGVTTSGINTYSTQSGNYYRIGKLVFIDIKIIVNVKDTNMAGPIVVSSLPFPCKYISALSIGHIEKVGTDGKFLSTRFSADGSSELFIYKANTGTTASVMSSLDIVDGSRIYISGSYAIN